MLIYHSIQQDCCYKFLAMENSLKCLKKLFLPWKWMLILFATSVSYLNVFLFFSLYTFCVVQPCLVCGKPGSVVCEDCSAEKDFAQDKMWCFFCDHCSKNWHSHGIRQTHKPWNKQKCQNFTSGTLQLLSVLCIETSHYVCFTRIMGTGGDKWVFFDSMAERPGTHLAFLFLPRMCVCSCVCIIVIPQL